jgi:hypothetical protein
MANRRYRSYRQEPRDEYSPDFSSRGYELEMKALQRQPSFSKFDYSKLEEDYPVTTIAEDFMIKERKRQEQKGLQEEINYRKSLIEDRASQLELKKAARDLDMYESQINREDAMLEQIPIARQKLADLDVRDPNFINKAYDIQDEHPMAFESQEFQKYVFQPMLNRNSRLSGRKQEGVITPDDAKKAMDEIMKYETLKEQEYPDEDHPEQLRNYLGIQQNTLNQFYSQRGMANPMGATAPQQGGIAPQPALAPSVEDSDTTTARRLISRRPELKDEINRRLISAGKPPIE